MRKNTIVINFETNEARVTKAFEKAANTFGTPEYRAWKACLSENPGIRMVTKTIKKKADKRTYKNMTYENMELYIRETRRELLDEFQRQKKISSIQSSPYRAVLAWFLTSSRTMTAIRTSSAKMRQRRAPILPVENSPRATSLPSPLRSTCD